MNSQNEQCYQLAIISPTDTIDTVVLFTFREMIINTRRAGMRLKMARFLSAVFPISNFKMAALLSAWICI